MPVESGIYRCCECGAYYLTREAAEECESLHHKIKLESYMYDAPDRDLNYIYKYPNTLIMCDENNRRVAYCLDIDSTLQYLGRPYNCDNSTRLNFCVEIEETDKIKSANGKIENAGKGIMLKHNVLTNNQVDTDRLDLVHDAKEAGFDPKHSRVYEERKQKLLNYVAELENYCRTDKSEKYEISESLLHNLYIELKYFLNSYC